MIYLDHNATTPLNERVLDAMLPFIKNYYANPSSLYRMGRLARSAIDTARAQVAALLDAHPEQVVFTSGGTEANNLASYNIPQHATLALSPLEHPSMRESIYRRADLFNRVWSLPVDQNGLIALSKIDPDQVSGLDWASVMLANNETGVIQPLSEIIGTLKVEKAYFHTDAVQACGKVSISFRRLEVDSMSVSSHKIYGPKGAGALLVKDVDSLKPILFGGGQEHGLRSGTENLPAIVGFGKAAELALSELDDRQRHVQSLQRKLENGLNNLPGCGVIAESVDRLTNTTMAYFTGLDGEMLQMQLDKHNVCVSSGSACSSGAGKPSPVLMAMGMDSGRAKSALRMSLGVANTHADIDEFIKVIKELM